MTWLIQILIILTVQARGYTGSCPKYFDANQCQIFNDTNAARKTNGMKPLKPSTTCTALAQAHALDMFQEAKLFHTSPKYGTFATRVDTYKVPGTWHGENVFWSSQGASYTPHVVAGWMQSPGHKANILSPQATALGVGVNHGYFAQCFSNE